MIPARPLFGEAQNGGPEGRTDGNDNRIGRIAFFLTRGVQRLRPLRQAMMTITRDEQRRGQSRMSAALWDMFSGSAPYSEILPRMIEPPLIAQWLRVLPRTLIRHAIQSSQWRKEPAL